MCRQLQSGFLFSLLGLFFLCPLASGGRADGDFSIVPAGYDLGKVGHEDRILGIAQIANAGRTPLTIRSVRSNCGCYKVSCADGTLRPGESAIAEFDLTFPKGKKLGDPVIYLLTEDKEKPMRYILMKMSLTEEPAFSTADPGEIIIQLDGPETIEDGSLESFNRRAGAVRVEKRPSPGRGKRYTLELKSGVNIELTAREYLRHPEVSLVFLRASEATQIVGEAPISRAPPPTAAPCPQSADEMPLP